ncbi:MAG: EAL domain-containing protein [Snowella sp.]|nr:EAL domain-containing protein [Snowella sp.]
MNNENEFRHILVIEDQKARRIISLEDPTYSIGRESSNDIIIYDQVVSRYHATLIRIKPSPKVDNYCYRILDGDLEGNRSRNGLMINGKNMESHELKHGDVVFFGSQSKASYYIVSTSLEIALFNPLDFSQYEETARASVPPGDNKATMIGNDDDTPSLSQPQSTDLMRFMSFAELSPNPIIEIDFNGHILYLNPAASIKFKLIQKEGLNHPILAGLLNQAQNIRGNLLLREVQVKNEIYEQYVHYLTEHKVIRSYLSDVTQAKQTEASLTYQNFHNALTELPNRVWFEEQLAIAIAKAQRDNEIMAVMFLEFDNLSTVINSFGYDCGDQVLKSVAQRLTECLGASASIANWKTDQFVLLHKNPGDQAEIIHLAQKILNALEGLLEVSGQRLHLKGRIGIALYPQQGEDAATLLKNAHTALDQGYEDGRHAYAFYDAKAASKSTILLKLENLLYEALEQRQFYLTYQPQVNLKSHAITRIEALLRWKHPDLGEISPVKLVPLAEKTDLIIPIGHWILESACQQNKRWQDSGIPPLPITINLSLRQFQEPNLVETLTGILQKTELDPQWLEIELTETTIMANQDLSLSVLQQLQSLGVRIALDDFGTGQGSFQCLQQFKVDSLKIDSSFILNLHQRPQDLALINAMIQLGHSYHTRVIAEGVENEAVVNRLQELDCDDLQGFWFCQPLKTEDATQFLRQSTIQSN